MGFSLVPPISRNLTDKSRPSEQEQDVAAGAYPFANPFSKVAADDRGFHPSVFSPGVCEAMAEFAANSFDESQDLPGGTPGSASHSTFLRGKERPPGVLACPFEDCDFRHLVDYTQATLEESWKTHVYDVHWPTPTKNWKSCGWEGCGLALKNRSSAWNHLAVHIKHFHIRCPTEGCFTYFSRAHLASKHVRETHTGKRRS